MKYPIARAPTAASANNAAGTAASANDAAGATIAASQVGEEQPARKKRKSRWGSEKETVAAGALTTFSAEQTEAFVLRLKLQHLNNLINDPTSQWCLLQRPSRYQRR